LALIALALTVGMLGGIALDQLFRLRNWRQALEARQQMARMDMRKRDRKQWLQDSTRMAAWDSVQRLRDPWQPREVARYQAFSNCAVSFQIRDTLARHMQLMEARAWHRSDPGRVIAHGWTFTPGGFQLSDTVTVVIPDVWCSEITIGGTGMSLILPTRGLGLDIR
jgi:hypothetical protein